MLKEAVILSVILLSFSRVQAGVKKDKDLAYAEGGTANLLDVYHKRHISSPQDVIIFIHGGSWNSGKKDTYWFLGRNFARKNKVMVIINYPLSPKAQYQDMADDCAKAVKWVQLNISKYGGNPDRIFLMGHSAGAHLAALINQDPQYFKNAGIKNTVKGVILDDPFGLDIHQYMKTQINTGDEYIPSFLQTFGSDEKNWVAASPMDKINGVHNPYQLFYGGETFPSIKMQTPAFYEALKKQGKIAEIEEISGKKHVGMISQMIWRCNKLYDKIINFINKHGDL